MKFEARLVLRLKPDAATLYARTHLPKLIFGNLAYNLFIRAALIWLREMCTPFIPSRYNTVLDVLSRERWEKK